MQTRRLFLRRSGLAMFGTGLAPMWLQRAAAAMPGKKKVLVVVFQRGAVDGLNVVVPYGEERYYQLRPTLAIPRTQAVDLDGFFGLHPALAPMKRIWEAGSLAVIQATGSPDPTRSHFDAQDYMESGTPGRKGTEDGWLNRALGSSIDAASPLRAVSMGPLLPRVLRGANRALAINNLNEFQVHDEVSGGTFESMYAASLDKVLKGTSKDAFDAVKTVQQIQKQTYVPANGARYPNAALGQSLQQIARLIKADVGLEAAFCDMRGWDTHVNQAPQLNNLLSNFGAALAAFFQDMGDQMSDVAVVTMSEFGRTARENGNRGTDHGHANVMFAFGGGIRGGKIHGHWPGLDVDSLYEGRDLAVTTDFRDVLTQLAVRHMGAPESTGLFPGYAPKPLRSLFA